MPNLQPAFKDNNIPIVFVANDEYIPYLATMIYSIAVHSSQDKNYDVVVLNRNITEDNEKQLDDMLSKYKNISLRLVDVTNYVSDYTFYTDNREDFSDEAYYRLLIPEIMKAYDKVLYFDSDMIALTDVAELYDTDLDGYLLASTRDLCGLMSYYNFLEDRKAYRDKTLGIKNPNDYFITGMLLFNIPAFREAYTCDYLLDFAASKDWMQHDQDILNVLCEGQVKFVSASWDVIKPELYQPLPAPYRKELDDSVEHPFIVHFGGDLKPWINLDTPNSEYFWQYAAQTPFIMEIIRRRIYLDREPYSVRGEMEREFREGKVGARYILRFIRAWINYKLKKSRHS